MSDPAGTVTKVRVQLVCQFGGPVRGISPYGDALSAALMTLPGMEIEAVDYKSVYPGILHPARTGHHRGSGSLAWYNPASWYRVASDPGDVLHLQHWAPQLASYLWPLVRLAKWSGKKVVITVHNPRPHERTGLFDMVERRMLCSADALIAHGRVSSELLSERLGEECPPVHSIPHGMDVCPEPTAATTADFERLGFKSGVPRVLLFGNLRPYKGVDVLLDAWQLVSAALPEARLVIAGQLWSGKRRAANAIARVLGTGASEPSRLSRRLVTGNMPAGVEVREGFLDDSEIDALIRTSCVVVFPYLHFSGQSGAACRAAAMGKPVLVGKVGCLPDLVVDESWLVEPDDVTGLAEALVSKLSVPEVLAPAGARQLAKIRDLDWSVVAKAHAAVYRSLA